MIRIKIILFAALLFGGCLHAQNNARITSYYDSNDDKSYYLAWDIKTGKSIQYYWNGNDNKWDAFEINLPAAPLPGATGNILFDVYYDHNDRKAYYIAWDTKGGRSIQYYWNGNDNKWDAFEINLPASPLPGAIGEVMIKSYFDSKDGKAYYLVYDTNGGKSIQYYWNGTSSKWEPFEINLPVKPLAGK
ncbi:MAG: hypothetical protein K0Q95_855 [Bacteroidota bacterium]|jgi:hypothetical protein|nr:hypothetical protein [Bacteroidota bacterium]